MTLDVINPATEKPIAHLDRAGAAETDRAVAAARAAFPAWRAVKPADRMRLLRRVASLVEQRGEELARLETANAGKPLGDSRWEMGMVADVFHFYAGAIDKHYGETIPVAGGVDMTFREPLGVVGLIVPWNFPLMLAAWKLGPSLACGNTVVLKPAELTPLTALRFAEIALEAGLPEGVVNVVVGPGSTVGERLIAHPDVAKIGFTGSTEVGQRVMEGAARTVKRVTLELGGKSANVIFADADLEKAASSAPGAVFGNAGQDCCARSRILVQKSIYEKFTQLLTDATRRFKVGDPEAEGTDMGPLISASHRKLVASYVDGKTMFKGSVRSGLLVPVHARRGEQLRPRRARGGFRSGGGDHSFRGRGRGDTHRQRHAVRPVGLGLDPRRRAGDEGGALDRHRRAFAQLEHVGARGDSVWRLQAIGLRTRAGHARDGRLLRAQKRVPVDGRLAMGRLDGKVAVITGAAGGIGREAAILFSNEGASVCIADVGREAGEKTAAECREAFFVKADVSDPKSVQAMYAETEKRYGRIDILYNNAGIMPADDDSILITEPDAWDRVQAVNAKGV